MIHAVGLGIGADMGIHQENLAPFNIGITVPEVDPSIPKGLDLRPHEGNPCLVGLFDGVVKKSLFILTDEFLAHFSPTAKRIAPSAKRKNLNLKLTNSKSILLRYKATEDR
jgi:hypothetical protein